MGLSDSQLAQIVKDAGFPAGSWPTAIAIILAESGGNPNAFNKSNRDGSTDCGLFQINSVHKPSNCFDPANNAKLALGISHGGTNWNAWTGTYKNGKYLLYMPRGIAAAGGAGGSPGVQPVSVGLSDLPDISIIWNPKTYLRLAMILAGFVLIQASLRRMTGLTTGNIVKAATNVAKVVK